MVGMGGRKEGVEGGGAGVGLGDLRLDLEEGILFIGGGHHFK